VVLSLTQAIKPTRERGRSYVPSRPLSLLPARGRKPLLPIDSNGQITIPILLESLSGWAGL
jgi:hypothetical protein